MSLGMLLNLLLRDVSGVLREVGVPLIRAESPTPLSRDHSEVPLSTAYLLSKGLDGPPRTHVTVAHEVPKGLRRLILPTLPRKARVLSSYRQLPVPKERTTALIRQLTHLRQLRAQASGTLRLTRLDERGRRSV